MEFEFNKRILKFGKVLSDLDKFVFDCVDLLNSANVKYVIVSGYVALLFGRPRITEDIDVLIEHISFGKFKKFAYLVKRNGFTIMNSKDVSEL